MTEARYQELKAEQREERLQEDLLYWVALRAGDLALMRSRWEEAIRYVV